MTLTYGTMAEIYNEAHRAGLQAGNAKVPVPMLVGQETSLFSGKLDTTKPVEVVAGGLCGFSSVQLKPGNSRFANFLKKKGLARKDSYHGGVRIWVGEFGQSYEKKVAYAHAFRNVLEVALGEKYNVWVDARLD